MLGIRNIFANSALQAVASSIVLVDALELSAPIAANQKAQVKILLAFSVGAAGGFRFKLASPAAPTNYVNSAKVVDGVTVAPGSIVALVQAAAGDFANAFAVAGSHVLEMNATIENGATAGDIKLQFAQNTSNATAITVLRGAIMEITYL